MFILGLILIIIGVIGTALAVGLEMTAGEPIYFLIMKAVNCVFGCGGLVMVIKHRRKKK